MSALTIEATTKRQHRKQNHFRPDIQGLRAVAVLVVLFFHAGGGIIFPGGFIGVDVFFVISGFLITGHLIRTGTKTGRIDLADFYARRVRRILPAATVVLLFTALATILILPATRWESIGGEILASSFYLVNWVLAENTDYLNADAAPSPIQHYWTLAVEEQFYIIWPLLIIALLYFARKKSIVGKRQNVQIRRDLVQRYIAWGAVGLTLISLAWSIYCSAVNPAPAYFVTTTRMWEMGIGALIAVFATQLERIPARLGYVVGAVGLAAILVSSLLYDSSTVFPGYAALLPTLGAAGVIIGGMSDRAESGVGAVLKIPVMRWVGDLSYSLYLWHWPLIVVGTHLLGGHLGLWQGLIIVAISFIPAWLSYHYVENRIRTWSVIKSSTANALQMGALLMSFSMLLGMMVLLAAQDAAVRAFVPSPSVIAQLSSSSPIGDDADDDSARLFGAEALAVDPSIGAVVDHVASFSPTVVSAPQDNPKNYSMGCHQEFHETSFEACVFGDPDSDYVVALVGDSHAAQWLPALAPIAKAQGWRLETYTKSSCPLIGTAIAKGGQTFYSECYEWNQKAVEYLTGPDAPDHVIVSSSLYGTAIPGDSQVRTGSVSEGYTMVWNELKGAGVPVTVLLDTPHPQINVPECVAENGDRLSECAVPREEAMRNGAQQQLSAAQAVGAPTLDLTDSICPHDQCAAIVGNVLVYRDTNHLTATYSRSLTSDLEATLREQGNLPFTA